MVDLLQDPELEGKKFARSFYYRNKALGKTLKTDQYRIVRWATEKDSMVGVELYDHLNDPYENNNIALENTVLTDSLLNNLTTTKFLDEDVPFANGWE